MTNNEFFDIYMKHQFKHVTIKSYYSRVNYLKNHFMINYGDFSPSDITALDHRRCYHHRQPIRLLRVGHVGFVSFAVSGFHFQLTTICSQLGSFFFESGF